MGYWKEMRTTGDSYIERVRHTVNTLPTEDAKSAMSIKIAELEKLMQEAAILKDEDLIDDVLQKMLQLEKYLITVATVEHQRI